MSATQRRKSLGLMTDASRNRRWSEIPAKRAWYAWHRSLRFARRQGMA